MGAEEVITAINLVSGRVPLTELSVPPLGTRSGLFTVLAGLGAPADMQLSGATGIKFCLTPKGCATGLRNDRVLAEPGHVYPSVRIDLSTGALIPEAMQLWYGGKAPHSGIARLQLTHAFEEYRLTQAFSHVFWGCAESTPQAALELLRRHPNFPQDRTIYSVSAAQPEYYSRGQHKIVMRGLVVVACPDSMSARELLIVAKIPIEPGDITIEEINFHRWLMSAQGRSRLVSEQIGYSAYQFPGSKEPDLSMVDCYEPGVDVAAFLDTKYQQAASALASGWCCSYIHALLEHAKTAKDDRCTATSLEITNGTIPTFPFVADINPRNLRTSNGRTAILIDTGHFHSNHTVPEILLRTIEYFGLNTRAVLGESESRVIPLAPMLHQVVKKFGKLQGKQLIGELAVYLSLLVGERWDRLSHLCDPATCNVYAQKLSQTYSCSLWAIGSAVRAGRRRFREALVQAGDGARHDWGYLNFSPNRLPYHFSEGQLKAIRDQVVEFLNPTKPVLRSSYPAITPTVLNRFGYSRPAHHYLYGASITSPCSHPVVVEFGDCIAAIARSRLNLHNLSFYDNAHIVAKIAGELQSILFDEPFVHEGHLLRVEIIAPIFNTFLRDALTSTSDFNRYGRFYQDLSKIVTIFFCLQAASGIDFLKMPAQILQAHGAWGDIVDKIRRVPDVSDIPAILEEFLQIKPLSPAGYNLRGRPAVEVLGECVQAIDRIVHQMHKHTSTSLRRISQQYGRK